MIKALFYSRLSCCKISYPLIHRLILILLFYLLFKSYINKIIRCWEKLGYLTIAILQTTPFSPSAVATSTI